MEQQQLAIVLEQGLAELSSTKTIPELEQVKSRYLGKSGQISSLMQQIKSIAPESRKDFGAKVNALKNEFEIALDERKKHIIQLEMEQSLLNETIDVTLSGRGISLGTLHPVTLSLQRMIRIFNTLGFSVQDGPEIETDYYNFEALNFPQNHPARAMQDTFFTEKLSVLRTHTSPIQIRFAEANPPPIKIIAPGRVYRVDMDRTHSPMFHQLEGLWIDKDISFANLKGVLIQFLRTFFAKEDLQVRFRASFFPFTEPSAEIDIMDDNGRWLEVAGCGMVHPNVLKSMNIDSKIYTGFAFGLGIDRFTMLRYNINDLRLIFDNELDFLEQFRGQA
ncbi:MAG: phenylalanine--tRNA ligase subunit alpha [Burkholderiales bacterium]|jgi:phenylalanyl-tRNA synthetase alpha chain|nr:phenylalanine--tRNA ligase subunit alpha [Burkholderiales bacterium]